MVPNNPTTTADSLANTTQAAPLNWDVFMKLGIPLSRGGLKI